MLHRVSGTKLHFPGTVYGISLKTTIICGLELFGLHLAQVGKMKRKFGPRPSQEVRLNPRQSRSERHSFAGGPKKRESAGAARRRVRKTRKIAIFSPSSAERSLRMKTPH